MCGISGFLADSNFNEESSRHYLKLMCDSIERRGPDAAGYWLDANAGIALGHRRLSIVDLSEHGHQPMHSACGRFVIVFNGEIYNFNEIRAQLEAENAAPDWRGHSDTEVLLAAIRAWGIEPALKSLSGMFAFALWDREQRVLTFARDRLGEKPLYYGRIDDVLVFGSELKALRKYPGFSRVQIDRSALSLYMRHNSIPAPHTIYSGIRKLVPGTFAQWRQGQREAEVRPYWTLAQAVADGRANPFHGDSREALDTLDDLLRDVVRKQMVADVPLGAFLSGGIDSSTVVALMQSQSARPVRTFTIGFHEQEFNEAEHARAVARHLGTDHTELYVTAAHALDVVPQLPSIYDEPFSDSSQIPTFLVSQMTRQHVTVSLSGDAGDELFCGYNRYFVADGLWSKLKLMPAPLRRICARMMGAMPAEHLDRILTPLMRLLPAHRRHMHIGEKLHKLAAVIDVNGRDELYKRLVSVFYCPEQIVVGGTEPSTLLDSPQSWPTEVSFAEQMMYLDTLTYLPTDILTKVDRAAMAVSLETRVPFLDHRVVEFAWRLPTSMKMRGTKGKWLLRELLYQYVPEKLIDRPKQGFAVPIGRWLRGELREWASQLLEPTRLKNEGFFHVAAVQRIWQQHLSGTYNWQHQLWSILMFQAWLDANS
ncbi:asparagine synthase (glutamine-hydrolyzing) [Burkholderia sp. PU8-34]